MSNYTVDICKTIISSGITNKPDDCEQSIWDEAVAASNAGLEGFARSEEPVEEKPVSNMSFATFGANSSNSLDTDHSLKNKSGGFWVDGQVEILKTPFTAKLMLKKSLWKESIKTNVSNKINYYSTLNYKTCTDGRPWDQVVRQCQQLDTAAYPYPSADLYFVVDKDLKAADGSVAVKAGESLSFSTPATAKKMLIAFRNECMEKGLANNDEVNVKVSFKLETNKSNQSWQLLTIELI